MSRVKRGVMANKRRKNTLAMTKGYRFGRSKKEAQAREAIRHAGKYAFRDRRAKKRTARQVWTIKINASLDAAGISYSKFIGAMKKKNIELDRKVLAQLAETHAAAFAKVIEAVNK